VQYFPAIFNVADMAIVASMVVFIVLTVRGIGLTGRTAVVAVPTTADATTSDVR
jgi:signal peptidase II